MKTVLIDCGHGGIDKKGNYTTAPKKMFKHGEHDIAYEGYINRKVGNILGIYLECLGIDIDYTVKPDNPSDLSLTGRTKKANTYDPNDVIFISLHSNASASHKARGIEVFTSRGETLSDVIATYIGTALIDEFPNIRFRADYTDGDLDKEANFWVLRKTKCPSVLVEFLFFDNAKDWKLLKDEMILKRYAWRLATSLFHYINTLKR